MRIVIFHDHFRVFGGAEKLVLTLARSLKCDVVTSEVDNFVIHEAGFGDIHIRTLKGFSLTSFFPPSAMRKRFQNCDIHKEYDFFIFSGSHSVLAAKKHKPNIWYCHSTDRGLYGNSFIKEKEETIFEAIISAKNKVTNKRIFPSIFSEIGAHLFVFLPKIISDLFSTFRIQKRTSVITFLKVLFENIFFSFSLYKYRVTKQADQEAISHIQKIVSSCINIQKKVKGAYGRKSHIAYPPTDCSNLKYEKGNDFWLSVSRIVPEKRIDIQINAFRNTPNEKLFIAGGYEKSWKRYANELFKNLPDNVVFLGPVYEGELINLYATCKGFITTSYDEDFGMTAIEAMASGKPVIAPNEGGYKETVIDGKTGLLIDDIDDKKLRIAIAEIGINTALYKDACILQAQKFDTGVFIKKIKDVIGV